VCFVAIKVVKLIHAIAWILEREKLEPEGGQLLERVLPFRPSFFLPLAGAGLLLRWVVAALSIPQGVRSSNHRHGCLVVSGTDHF
jgi:hypothetical protein